MAKINSKAKGSSFERQLAKQLSDWAGEPFHRTPMSGALHWANDNRVVSDIVPPQHLVDNGWPFSIECKNVECSWELNVLIEGTATFWKHWEQCKGDSEREHMVPMLVFTKNYRSTFVALELSVYEQLNLLVENRLLVIYKGIQLVVLSLSDLLSSISCEELLKRDLLKKFSK